MKEGFGDRVSFSEPEGGLFIWCTLPDDVRLSDFSAKATASGVTFIPGNMLALSRNDCTDAFRLNFSTPDDRQIEEGIGRLATVLNSL
jgi:2-aminoadipate transaminase